MQLQTILDYVQCPLKTNFPKPPKDNNLSEVYRKLIVKFLTESGLRNRMDSRAIHVYLNTIWNDFKKDNPGDQDLIEIARRVREIPNLLGPNDQLVTINYESSWSKKNIQISDTCDGVILKSAPDYHLDIWFLDDSSTPGWIWEIRSAFYSKTLSTQFDPRPIRLRVIDLPTGKEKYYAPEVNNFLFLKNGYKALERNYLFPSPSKGVCKDCHANKLCSWSVTK